MCSRYKGGRDFCFPSLDASRIPFSQLGLQSRLFPPFLSFSLFFLPNRSLLVLSSPTTARPPSLFLFFSLFLHADAGLQERINVHVLIDALAGSQAERANWSRAGEAAGAGEGRASSGKLIEVGVLCGFFFSSLFL